MISDIRHAIEAAGLFQLDVEQDDTGIYLRHDTGDNTSKENYDDALNDIGEIRACLLPLNCEVEIAMADHDTIIYKIIKEG